VSTTLLRVLVEGKRAEVAAVLHEDVRFRQGDGSVHRGREAVLTVFDRSDPGVRYEVLEEAHGTVRVALHVEGVSGGVSFLLCGRAVQGRLVEVWVET